jgi:hypothetical protein
MTVRVLRSTARRVQALAAEAADLEVEIAKLVRAVARQLFKLLEGHQRAPVEMPCL